LKGPEDLPDVQADPTGIRKGIERRSITGTVITTIMLTGIRKGIESRRWLG